MPAKIDLYTKYEIAKDTRLWPLALLVSKLSCIIDKSSSNLYAKSHNISQDFHAFNNLLVAFCSVVDGDRFLIVSMYVYINCLNSFLIDRKVGVWTKTSFKSRLGELEIVKLDALEASLFYVIASLEVERLSSSLKIIKPCRSFLNK